MEKKQSYKALFIIVGFLLLHTIVNSVSPYWTDGNNNIYSLESGNVGIGTSDPKDKLHIWGGGLSINDGTGLCSINTGKDALNDRIEIMSGDEDYMNFILNNNVIIFLGEEGSRVGIGTINPTDKLTVNGTIRAKKVKATADIPADYVFEDCYNLLTLDEVELFIRENGHLPDIPSGKTMIQDGIELSDMNMKLLQKIEELTLYTIEQEKQISELKNHLTRLENLEYEISSLKAVIQSGN